MRIAAASVLLAALLAASAAFAAATREDPQFKPNPADQAAARAALLRSTDLGGGWQGGAKSAGRPQGLDCATFHAKQSDLVVTGIAQSGFSKSGVDIESQIQVLQTPAMVVTDFARTVRPEVMRCLGAQLESQAGLTAKVVSITRIPFPSLGSVRGAFRISVDVTAQGQTIPIVMDVVAVGVRRTEVALFVTAPAAAKAAVAAAEQRLARVLVARTKV